MSNQHMTSPGPARDDPVFGDPLHPGAPAAGGAAAGEQARQAAATAAGQARDVASTAREEARDVASTARDEVRDVATTARDEARQVAGSARHQAQRLAGDARHELRLQASAQLDRLAEGVDSLSEQLRSMGEHGQPGAVTDLVHEAALRTQDVADRLRQGDVDDALDRLRSAGRNRPGVFLLGAFAAGLVAGRVARNLADDPDGRDNGAASTGSAVPAVGPAVAAGPTAGPGPAIPVPPEPAPGVPPGHAAPEVGSGQTAYGAPVAPPVAPVSDERWGS